MTEPDPQIQQIRFVEAADQVATEYFVLRDLLAEAHRETPKGAAGGGLNDLDTVAALLLPIVRREAENG